MININDETHKWVKTDVYKENCLQQFNVRIMSYMFFEEKTGFQGVKPVPVLKPAKKWFLVIKTRNTMTLCPFFSPVTEPMLKNFFNRKEEFESAASKKILGEFNKYPELDSKLARTLLRIVNTSEIHYPVEGSLMLNEMDSEDNSREWFLKALLYGADLDTALRTGLYNAPEHDESYSEFLDDIIRYPQEWMNSIYGYSAEVTKNRSGLVDAIHEYLEKSTSPLL